MMEHEKVNILLVDDQPAKLLAYEVILKELGENLAVATSGREALEYLLKNEVAIILVDVCMPELDGFELAAMIREHPRFTKTPMIFVTAMKTTDLDRLRGYEIGAVDYVPVPVVPEVLRAKIKVSRSSIARPVSSSASTPSSRIASVRARRSWKCPAAQLVESERRRSMAIAAGKMGSWDWDWINGDWMWDAGQYPIFGVDPHSFEVTSDNVQAMLHPDDADSWRKVVAHFETGARAYETEFRIRRPDGEVRWCVGTAAATVDKGGRVVRLSGVTIDITERKRAEERQNLLAREVDRRAKNALALAQSIVRLTRANEVKDYVQAVEGRISALARVHTILSLSNWEGAEVGRLIEEEIAPCPTGGRRFTARSCGFSRRPRRRWRSRCTSLSPTPRNIARTVSPVGPPQYQMGSAPRRAAARLGGPGGPPVEQPISRGFGTRSVIASIESQLGGKAEFDWRSEGFSPGSRCRSPGTRRRARPAIQAWPRTAAQSGAKDGLAIMRRRISG